MSPQELRSLSDEQLIDMLMALGPDGAAIAWIASVVTDESAFDGVRELRRRFIKESCPVAKNREHHPSANSVEIDPDRFKAFAYRRRLTLMAIGPMIGKSDAWASMACHKRRASFWILDELATELGMGVNELIEEIGSERELARVSV